MGYNPQESPENTINTMHTLLGVHPSVSWFKVIFLRIEPWDSSHQEFLASQESATH